MRKEKGSPSQRDWQKLGPAGSSRLSSTALEEKASVVKICFNEGIHTYTHKNVHQNYASSCYSCPYAFKELLFKYNECFKELHCWCDESGPPSSFWKVLSIHLLKKLPGFGLCK